MALTSLVDSCGPEVWSLEIRLQSCPPNSVASLAFDCLRGRRVSGTCSHNDAASWTSQSLRSTHQNASLPSSRPGQAVLCSWLGLVGFVVALWLLCIDPVALLISSALPHDGYDSRRFNILTFVKAWLCLFSLEFLSLAVWLAWYLFHSFCAANNYFSCFRGAAL